MSSSGNEDELIANFVAVTDIDSARARFYLEASGWELQVALASFFENDHDDDAEPVLPTLVTEQTSSLQDRHPNLLSQISQGITEGTGLGNPSLGAVSRPAKVSAPERSGPATLDSIRSRPVDNDSSEDEEEKRQAFYAGGSQSSGQQVLGPPKKRDELVTEMFKKARELGAEDVNAAEPSSKKKGTAFGGTGYKLGEKSTESERVAPEADSSSEGQESREVVLRLWSTGFTVDDGPLRSFVDPANIEFLGSVKRGEIPRELIRNNQGRQVELTMEDRRHEEYVAPKPSSRPFSGVGQMLGSPAPTIIGGTGQVTESDRLANESAARSLIAIVGSEPTTNIQFRLADGTRLVAQFNHTHTVNDLHLFINTARPQFSTVNYVLALFPSTELTEMNVTVKEANLLNSALIQKIK